MRSVFSIALEESKLDILLLGSLIQSIVIFCFVFGSVMFLPKLTEKLGFVKSAFLWAMFGVFVGLVISWNGQLQSG